MKENSETIENNEEASIDEEMSVFDANYKYAREIETFYYTKDNELFQIKRIAILGNELRALTYEIDIIMSGGFLQNFISSEIIQGDTFITLMEDKYSNFIPYPDTSILLMHFLYKFFKDEYAFELRECNINMCALQIILLNYQLGKLVKCDYGTSGVSYYFEVDDINRSLKEIARKASEIGTDGRIILAKAVHTSKTDCFYEVIYPYNYTGQLILY